MRKPSKEDLDVVFGEDSYGESPSERAQSSLVLFVRSQVQMTFANASSQGWRMSASEALEAYGWDALFNVAVNGFHSLVYNADEPSATLKSARERLGIDIVKLAARVNINPAVIRKVEQKGVLSPINILVRIAQSLALDPTFLSTTSGAKGDAALGVRLRQQRANTDFPYFSEKSVLDLAEAAFVIAEQAKLAARLNYESHIITKFKHKDNNYNSPPYAQGYRLASQTRRLLALGLQPIKNLRLLIEEELGIPLIQQDLEPRFAGATLSNGPFRGIVVNLKGMNQNVWVRRMTLCHELGHLMWDPDQKLNKLRVDLYSELEESFESNRSDNVEARANAFAVAFLAPPEAIKKIVTRSDLHGSINKIIDMYGISVTAARRHVSNVCQISINDIPMYDYLEASPEWLAAENFAADYFPLQSTPVSRRGRFAGMVASALDKNLISLDSAVFLLSTESDALWENKSYIKTLY